MLSERNDVHRVCCLSPRRIRAWVCVGLVWAGSACAAGPGRDISSVDPYASMIGARYVVVADDLEAYGVYGSIDDRIVSFVELIPARPGIGGVEIAFRRRVRKGQIIRILSAWRRFILFEFVVYYRVELENSDLSKGLPARLTLMRGNGDSGADLNPTIYRRLGKD